MTLQQLEYLIEIDRNRSFIKAANTFDCSQAALSKAIKNLEEELDVVIFDRTGNSISPTSIGQKLIAKAKRILKDIEDLKSVVRAEATEASGTLRLSLGTSLSSYMISDIIYHFDTKVPKVQLSIEERSQESMLEALKKNDIDIAVEVGGLTSDTRLPDDLKNDILELIIYRERFVMYGSKKCKCCEDGMDAKKTDHSNMLVMSSAYNPNAAIRGNVDNQGKEVNFTGNIDNLVRYVDNRGGYTIIPELFAKGLSAEQQTQNICETDEYHLQYRDISIYINRGYHHDRILNEVINGIKLVVPKHKWVKTIYENGVRI